MGDKLPEQLYAAWRTALTDPSEVPVWGNLDAHSRGAWEVVAVVARTEMAGRFLASMRLACERQHLAAAAVVESAAGVLAELEHWTTRS